VLATQNPIELEGTYPLPEAQLDRFLFNTLLDYLTAEQELEVIGLTTTTQIAHADPVTNAEEILEFQQLVRMVPIADAVARYAIHLVRSTRYTEPGAPDFIRKYVNYGASVRAAQFLVLAAKARALMNRRYHVSYDDIRTLATPVLRHRILLNFHAESDRLRQDDILKQLLEAIPAPRGCCSASSAPPFSPTSRTSSLWLRRSWTDLFRGCTARRITASARSSPSIECTRPATTCVTSIGTSSRARNGLI
jgi:MoxR-like ATPase